MSSGNFRQRRTDQPKSDPGAHLLCVGQSVRLKSATGKSISPRQVYRITGTMPAFSGSPQYRIRNADEHHERVAMQDELEPIETVGTGTQATLMERTFGHGKGTKA
jgi:hypothetical protein